MFPVLVYIAGAFAAAALPDYETIVRENERAVVVIHGVRPDTRAEIQSSGCLVSGAGHILTTAHQIGGAAELEARLHDGTRHALELLALDDAREIALLRAPLRDAPHVRLGDAGALRAGAPLVSIAAPRSLEFSAVSGIVSNTNRTYRGYPVIQADLRASPGSSGGPVFNRHGELVGLIVGRLRDEDWITVINPVGNAAPILSRHGILGADPPPLADEDFELTPAEGVDARTLEAVHAYNRGVRSPDAAAKIGHYETAVRLLPEFFEAWFNLAIAQTRMQALEDALTSYARAEALRPEAVAVPRNVGRIHLMRGAHSQAEAAFRRALELAPESPQSYNDLGEVHRQAEHYEAAAAAFERAAALDASYAPAQYNLGLTRALQGQRGEAIAHFQRYLALRPGSSDAEPVQGWIRALQSEP